jgi:hypothetical protein
VLPTARAGTKAADALGIRANRSSILFIACRRHQRCHAQKRGLRNVADFWAALGQATACPWPDHMGRPFKAQWVGRVSAQAALEQNRLLRLRTDRGHAGAGFKPALAQQTWTVRMRIDHDTRRRIACVATNPARWADESRRYRARGVSRERAGLKPDPTSLPICALP